MLSDCVESATRSMTERKPSQIEQLVRDLSMKRLMDGQFDECNLTFTELAQIQSAITSRVNAIYHGRVAYPDQDEPGHDDSSVSGDFGLAGA
jgi:membrane-associated HD superfamily phosphohydrolase